MVDHLTPGPIPPDIATLADYERHAERRMPPASWAHVQEGAGEEATLHDNCAAFARRRLLPRMLADLRGGQTGVTIFGQRHAAPILLAPVAYQRLAHADGERATARAAAALSAGMIVSTLSSVTLEEIAAAGDEAAAALGTAAPRWFQLYLQPERAHSEALVRRAEAAGYRAIVLTVDAAVKPSRFVLPGGVEAANLRDLPRLRQTATAGGRILFGTPLLDTAPRWEDVAWLRTLTHLPLLLKGVLDPQDARRAVDAGVDGVIVSNHGGRVLDGTIAALDALPAIAAAVDVPLLLDGGVRTGTDVAKALALGARAVLVGRPQMHALAVAGTAGVAHALHLLRTELEAAMAQLGCATCEAVDRTRVVP